MNYFEHHIGDYAAATAHLSLIEDALYSRLLRRYYLQEEPLPADTKQVARLAGARTPEEVEAVQVVLEEFFSLQADGWHNKRADEEIERYRAKMDAARENGKKGGRPAKQPAGITQPKPEITQPFNSGSENETQLKAHQAPYTSNHVKQDQKKEQASPIGSRLPKDWQLPDDWRQWAEAERPGILIRDEAAKFADYWHGVAGAKGRKADWAGTWRNWIRNSRAIGNQRAGPVQAAPGKTMQALQALEDLKNGLVNPRNPDRIPEADLPRLGSSASR